MLTNTQRRTDTNFERDDLTTKHNETLKSLGRIAVASAWTLFDFMSMVLITESECNDGMNDDIIPRKKHRRFKYWNIDVTIHNVDVLGTVGN